MLLQHGADDGAVHAPVPAPAPTATAATAGRLLTLPEPCQDAAAGIQLTTHTTEVSTSPKFSVANPEDFFTDSDLLLDRFGFGP